MSDFVEKPIKKRLNRKNPISRIELVERRTGARPSATVRSLDEIAPDLGDQVAGRFIAPSDESASAEVTDSDFSGSFLAGEAQTPYDEAGAFNFGVVSAGVTTYGIGSAGEYAYGEGFTGVHKAVGTSTNERRLRRGFQEFQGSDEASYLFEYIDTNVGTNLITGNPGFESGSTTDWALTGAATSITTITPLSGTYSLIIDGTSGTATSVKYACTAGNVLSVSFLAYLYSGGGGGTTSIYINFYNATPTLLSAVVIKSAATLTLDTYSGNATVPSGATQFEIYIDKAVGGSILYLDDFSVSVVSISNKLGFHGENGAVITEAEDNEIANVAFGTGQIAKWPFLITGAASAGGSLDATANYYYQITFADNTGGESLPNTITAAIATTGVNKQITLSGIPKRPPGCTAVNIYRTEGGGATPYYLAAHTSDAVTYLDTAADASLTLSRTAPTYNSTIERPFYPTSFYTSSTVMLSNATLTRGISVGSSLNMFYGTTAANAADGDWFAFGVCIAKGTYTLEINGTTGTDRGKIDVYIDGTITGITGQDWYSNPAVLDVSKTGSVTIATSGYHQLILKVNGKNAASTDYRVLLSFIQLTPTAY